MSNTQAAQLLESGVIQGDQLVGQSFSKSGWLTKANPMDKAVSEAINSTYETNIMSGFDSNAKRAFLDYKNAADASGQNYNYQNINSMMKDNMINNSTADGTSIGFDFSKSGDYNLYNPNEPTSYQFNGKKTFKTNNGKSTLSKIKNAAKGKALDTLKNSLLLQEPKFEMADLSGLYGDTTQQTDGSTGYSGTSIHGSSGGSLLEGAFSASQQEQIMNYYKHMNIIGSH